MAIKPPCVVDDTRIIQLIESGALNKKYETKNTNFNYPTLAELTKRDNLQKELDKAQEESKKHRIWNPLKFILKYIHI